jgi:hypothetical protein
MCKQELTIDIKTLFTDGLDAFTSQCERRTGHKELDENGKLTDRYARVLLTDYYIKGLHSKILSDMLYGNKLHDHPNELETLFRCGLIDENHELTPHGHYKAVSTLNFNNQIAYLDLPLDEFGPIEHSGGKPRENYAKEIYSDQYDFVISDEGNLFQFIKICFIYSARRYFIDNGFNPELLEAIYHQPLDYFLAIPLGLLMGKEVNFYQKTRHKKHLTKEYNFEKLISIAKTSISQAIREVPIEALFCDAKRMRNLFPMRCGTNAHQAFEEALHQLGEGSIRKFIIFLFEHPTPDNRGWSDLSVFHQGQYIPIEIKGGDKLTFSQIERYFWLKNNVPEHAKNQRVSQILFY